MEHMETRRYVVMAVSVNNVPLAVAAAAEKEEEERARQRLRTLRLRLSNYGEWMSET